MDSLLRYLPLTIVQYVKTVDPAVFLGFKNGPHTSIAQPTTQECQGAVLFADISGFTAITEYMNQTGGTDEGLANTLNSYFQILIRNIEKNHGVIMRFLGDAMLVIFVMEGQDGMPKLTNLTQEEMTTLLRRATECALDIKEDLGGFKIPGRATVSTPTDLYQSSNEATSPGVFLTQDQILQQGSAKGPDQEVKLLLDIKIGISSGSMNIMHVDGGYSRFEYILTGSPLVESFTAESMIQDPRGPSVVVSPAAWALIWKFFKPAKLAKLDEKDPKSNTGTDVSNAGKKPPLLSSPSSSSQPDPSSTGPVNDIYTFVLSVTSQLRQDARTRQQATLQMRDILSDTTKTIMKRYLPQSIIPWVESGQERFMSELREVTVLFISTGLATKVETPSQSGSSKSSSLPGPNSDPLLMLRSILMTVQSAVVYFGGEINKFMVDDKGTTIIAVFGLPPQAHENDALRGVYAALAVVYSLRSITVGNQPLSPSIGITTGRAFCGGVGSTKRKEYTVLGDAVNLSARFMQKAGALQKEIHGSDRKSHVPIICDTTTRNLAANHIVFKQVEPMSVKGKAQLIDGFRPFAITYNRLYSVLGMSSDLLIRPPAAMVLAGKMLSLNPDGYEKKLPQQTLLPIQGSSANLLLPKQSIQLASSSSSNFSQSMSVQPGSQTPGPRQSTMDPMSLTGSMAPFMSPGRRPSIIGGLPSSSLGTSLTPSGGDSTAVPLPISMSSIGSMMQGSMNSSMIAFACWQRLKSFVANIDFLQAGSSGSTKTVVISRLLPTSLTLGATQGIFSLGFQDSFSTFSPSEVATAQMHATPVNTATGTSQSQSLSQHSLQGLINYNPGSKSSVRDNSESDSFTLARTSNGQLSSSQVPTAAISSSNPQIPGRSGSSRLDPVRGQSLITPMASIREMSMIFSIGGNLDAAGNPANLHLPEPIPIYPFSYFLSNNFRPVLNNNHANNATQDPSGQSPAGYLSNISDVRSHPLVLFPIPDTAPVATPQRQKAVTLRPGTATATLGRGASFATLAGPAAASGLLPSMKQNAEGTPVETKLLADMGHKSSYLATTLQYLTAMNFVKLIPFNLQRNKYTLDQLLETYLPALIASPDSNDGNLLTHDSFAEPIINFGAAGKNAVQVSITPHPQSAGSDKNDSKNSNSKRDNSKTDHEKSETGSIVTNVSTTPSKPTVRYFIDANKNLNQSENSKIFDDDDGNDSFTSNMSALLPPGALTPLPPLQQDFPLLQKITVYLSDDLHQSASDTPFSLISPYIHTIAGRTGSQSDGILPKWKRENCIQYTVKDLLKYNITTVGQLVAIVAHNLNIPPSRLAGATNSASATAAAIGIGGNNGLAAINMEIQQRNPLSNLVNSANNRQTKTINRRKSASMVVTNPIGHLSCFASFSILDNVVVKRLGDINPFITSRYKTMLHTQPTQLQHSQTLASLAPLLQIQNCHTAMLACQPSGSTGAINFLSNGTLSLHLDYIPGYLFAPSYIADPNNVEQYQEQRYLAHARDTVMNLILTHLSHPIIPLVESPKSYSTTSSTNQFSHITNGVSQGGFNSSTATSVSPATNRAFSFNTGVGQFANRSNQLTPINPLSPHQSDQHHNNTNFGPNEVAQLDDEDRFDTSNSRTNPSSSRLRNDSCAPSSISEAPSHGTVVNHNFSPLQFPSLAPISNPPGDLLITLDSSSGPSEPLSMLRDELGLFPSQQSNHSPLGANQHGFYAPSTSTMSKPFGTTDWDIFGHDFGQGVQFGKPSLSCYGSINGNRLQQQQYERTRETWKLTNGSLDYVTNPLAFMQPKFMTSAIEQPKRTKGLVVLIEGGAGLGKTLLLNSIKNQAVQPIIQATGNDVDPRPYSLIGSIVLQLLEQEVAVYETLYKTIVTFYGKAGISLLRPSDTSSSTANGPTIASPVGTTTTLGSGRDRDSRPRSSSRSFEDEIASTRTSSVPKHSHFGVQSTLIPPPPPPKGLGSNSSKNLPYFSNETSFSPPNMAPRQSNSTSSTTPILSAISNSHRSGGDNDYYVPGGSLPTVLSSIEPQFDSISTSNSSKNAPNPQTPTNNGGNNHNYFNSAASVSSTYYGSKIIPPHGGFNIDPTQCPTTPACLSDNVHLSMLSKNEEQTTNSMLRNAMAVRQLVFAARMKQCLKERARFITFEPRAFKLLVSVLSREQSYNLDASPINAPLSSHHFGMNNGMLLGGNMEQSYFNSKMGLEPPAPVVRFPSAHGGAASGLLAPSNGGRINTISLISSPGEGRGSNDHYSNEYNNNNNIHPHSHNNIHNNNGLFPANDDAAIFNLISPLENRNFAPTGQPLPPNTYSLDQFNFVRFLPLLNLVLPELEFTPTTVSALLLENYHQSFVPEYGYPIPTPTQNNPNDFPVVSPSTNHTNGSINNSNNNVNPTNNGFSTPTSKPQFPHLNSIATASNNNNNNNSNNAELSHSSLGDFQLNEDIADSMSQGSQHNISSPPTPSKGPPSLRGTPSRQPPPRKQNQFNTQSTLTRPLQANSDRMGVFTPGLSGFGAGIGGGIVDPLAEFTSYEIHSAIHSLIGALLYTYFDFWTMYSPIPENFDLDKDLLVSQLQSSGASAVNATAPSGLSNPISNQSIAISPLHQAAPCNSGLLMSWNPSESNHQVTTHHQIGAQGHMSSMKEMEATGGFDNNNNNRQNIQCNAHLDILLNHFARYQELTASCPGPVNLYDLPPPPALVKADLTPFENHITQRAKNQQKESQSNNGKNIHKDLSSNNGKNQGFGSSSVIGGHKRTQSQVQLRHNDALPDYGADLLEATPLSPLPPLDFDEATNTSSNYNPITANTAVKDTPASLGYLPPATHGLCFIIDNGGDLDDFSWAILSKMPEEVPNSTLIIATRPFDRLSPDSHRRHLINENFTFGQAVSTTPFGKKLRQYQPPPGYLDLVSHQETCIIRLGNRHDKTSASLFTHVLLNMAIKQQTVGLDKLRTMNVHFPQAARGGFTETSIIGAQSSLMSPSAASYSALLTQPLEESIQIPITQRAMDHPKDWPGEIIIIKSMSVPFSIPAVSIPGALLSFIKTLHGIPQSIRECPSLLKLHGFLRFGANISRIEYSSLFSGNEPARLYPRVKLLIPIPQHIKSLLASMCDNLSPSQMMILKTAALIGHAFNFNLLMRSLPFFSPNEVRFQHILTNSTKQHKHEIIYKDFRELLRMKIFEEIPQNSTRHEDIVNVAPYSYDSIHSVHSDAILSLQGYNSTKLQRLFVTSTLDAAGLGLHGVANATKTETEKESSTETKSLNQNPDKKGGSSVQITEEHVIRHQSLMQPYQLRVQPVEHLYRFRYSFLRDYLHQRTLNEHKVSLENQLVLANDAINYIEIANVLPVTPLTITITQTKLGVMASSRHEQRPTAICLYANDSFLTHHQHLQIMCAQPVLSRYEVMVNSNPFGKVEFFAPISVLKQRVIDININDSTHGFDDSRQPPHPLSDVSEKIQDVYMDSSSWKLQRYIALHQHCITVWGSIDEFALFLAHVIIQEYLMTVLKSHEKQFSYLEEKSKENRTVKILQSSFQLSYSELRQFTKKEIVGFYNNVASDENSRILEEKVDAHLARVSLLPQKPSPLGEGNIVNTFKPSAATATTSNNSGKDKDKTEQQEEIDLMAMRFTPITTQTRSTIDFDTIDVRQYKQLLDLGLLQPVLVLPLAHCNVSGVEEIEAPMNFFPSMATPANNNINNSNMPTISGHNIVPLHPTLQNQPMKMQLLTPRAGVNSGGSSSNEMISMGMGHPHTTRHSQLPSVSEGQSRFGKALPQFNPPQGEKNEISNSHPHSPGNGPNTNLLGPDAFNQFNSDDISDFDIDEANDQIIMNHPLQTSMFTITSTAWFKHGLLLNHQCQQHFTFLFNPSSDDGNNGVGAGSSANFANQGTVRDIDGFLSTFQIMRPRSVAFIDSETPKTRFRDTVRNLIVQDKTAPTFDSKDEVDLKKDFLLSIKSGNSSSVILSTALYCYKHEGTLIGSRWKERRVILFNKALQFRYLDAKDKEGKSSNTKDTARQSTLADQFTMTTISSKPLTIGYKTPNGTVEWYTDLNKIDPLSPSATTNPFDNTLRLDLNKTVFEMIPPVQVNSVSAKVAKDMTTAPLQVASLGAGVSILTPPEGKYKGKQHVLELNVGLWFKKGTLKWSPRSFVLAFNTAAERNQLESILRLLVWNNTVEWLLRKHQNMIIDCAKAFSYLIESASSSNNDKGGRGNANYLTMRSRTASTVTPTLSNRGSIALLPPQHQYFSQGSGQQPIVTMHSNGSKSSHNGPIVPSSPMIYTNRRNSSVGLAIQQGKDGFNLDMISNSHQPQDSKREFKPITTQASPQMDLYSDQWPSGNIYTMQEVFGGLIKQFGKRQSVNSSSPLAIIPPVLNATAVHPDHCQCTLHYANLRKAKIEKSQLNENPKGDEYGLHLDEFFSDHNRIRPIDAYLTTGEAPDAPRAVNPDETGSSSGKPSLKIPHSVLVSLVDGTLDDDSSDHSIGDHRSLSIESLCRVSDDFGTGGSDYFNTSATTDDEDYDAPPSHKRRTNRNRRLMAESEHSFTHDDECQQNIAGNQDSSADEYERNRISLQSTVKPTHPLTIQVPTTPVGGTPVTTASQGTGNSVVPSAVAQVAAANAAATAAADAAALEAEKKFEAAKKKYELLNNNTQVCASCGHLSIHAVTCPKYLVMIEEHQLELEHNIYLQRQRMMSETELNTAINKLEGIDLQPRQCSNCDYVCNSQFLVNQLLANNRTQSPCDIVTCPNCGLEISLKDIEDEDDDLNMNIYGDEANKNDQNGANTKNSRKQSFSLTAEDGIGKTSNFLRRSSDHTEEMARQANKTKSYRNENDQDTSDNSGQDHDENYDKFGFDDGNRNNLSSSSSSCSRVNNQRSSNSDYYSAKSFEKSRKSHRRKLLIVHLQKQVIRQHKTSLKREYQQRNRRNNLINQVLTETANLVAHFDAITAHLDHQVNICSNEISSKPNTPSMISAVTEVEAVVKALQKGLGHITAKIPNILMENGLGELLHYPQCPSYVETQVPQLGKYKDKLSQVIAIEQDWDNLHLGDKLEAVMGYEGSDSDQSVHEEVEEDGEKILATKKLIASKSSKSSSKQHHRRAVKAIKSPTNRLQSSENGLLINLSHDSSQNSTQPQHPQNQPNQQRPLRHHRADRTATQRKSSVSPQRTPLPSTPLPASILQSLPPPTPTTNLLDTATTNNIQQHRIRVSSRPPSRNRSSMDSASAMTTPPASPSGHISADGKDGRQNRSQGDAAPSFRRDTSVTSQLFDKVVTMDGSAPLARPTTPTSTVSGRNRGGRRMASVAGLENDNSGRDVATLPSVIDSMSIVTSNPQQPQQSQQPQSLQSPAQLATTTTTTIKNFGAGGLESSYQSWLVASYTQELVQQNDDENQGSGDPNKDGRKGRNRDSAADGITNPNGRMGDVEDSLSIHTTDTQQMSVTDGVAPSNSVSNTGKRSGKRGAAASCPDGPLGDMSNTYKNQQNQQNELGDVDIDGVVSPLTDLPLQQSPTMVIERSAEDKASRHDEKNVIVPLHATESMIKNDNIPHISPQKPQPPSQQPKQADVTVTHPEPLTLRNIAQGEEVENKIEVTAGAQQHRIFNPRLLNNGKMSTPEDETLADLVFDPLSVIPVQFPRDAMYYTVLEGTKKIIEQSARQWDADYELIKKREKSIYETYANKFGSTDHLLNPSDFNTNNNSNGNLPAHVLINPSGNNSNASGTADVQRTPPKQEALPLWNHTIAAPILGWAYNTFEAPPEVLLLNVVRMLASFDIPMQFQIDPTKLATFLCAVWHGYNNTNPYHSIRHAMDVTATVYSFLTLGQAAQLMSNLERFALIIASLCHDIDHPLVNNGYCVTSRNAFASISNDQGVLEYHHCRVTWTILSRPECNIIAKLSKNEFNEFRKISLLSIMATDMTQHFNLVERFAKLLDQLEDWKCVAPERSTLSSEYYNKHTDFMLWIQKNQSALLEKNAQNDQNKKKMVLSNDGKMSNDTEALDIIQLPPSRGVGVEIPIIRRRGIPATTPTSSNQLAKVMNRPSSSHSTSTPRSQEHQTTSTQQRRGPNIHIGTSITGGAPITSSSHIQPSSQRMSQSVSSQHPQISVEIQNNTPSNHPNGLSYASTPSNQSDSHPRQLTRRASVILTPNRQNCIIQVAVMGSELGNNDDNNHLNDRGSVTSGGNIDHSPYHGASYPPGEIDVIENELDCNGISPDLYYANYSEYQGDPSWPYNANPSHNADMFYDSSYGSPYYPLVTRSSLLKPVVDAAPSTASSASNTISMYNSNNSLASSSQYNDDDIMISGGVNAARSKFTFFNSALPLTQDLPSYAFVRRISFTDRVLIIQMLLHAADISNPTKPWRHCKRWADVVCNEFLIQGDLEQYYGFPISPNCNRRETNLAMLNVSFADFVVAPLFFNLKRLLPDINVLCEQLSSNRNTWCLLYTTFINSTLARLNAIYTLKTMRQKLLHLREKHRKEGITGAVVTTNDLLHFEPGDCGEITTTTTTTNPSGETTTTTESLPTIPTLTEDENMSFGQMFFPFVAPPHPTPVNPVDLKVIFDKLTYPAILPHKDILRDKAPYAYSESNLQSITLTPQDDNAKSPPATNLLFALPTATVNVDLQYWKDEFSRWNIRKSTYETKYYHIPGESTPVSQPAPGTGPPPPKCEIIQLGNFNFEHLIPQEQISQYHPPGDSRVKVILEDDYTMFVRQLDDILTTEAQELAAAEIIDGKIVTPSEKLLALALSTQTKQEDCDHHHDINILSDCDVNQPMGGLSPQVTSGNGTQEQPQQQHQQQPPQVESKRKNKKDSSPPQQNKVLVPPPPQQNQQNQLQSNVIIEESTPSQSQPSTPQPEPIVAPLQIPATPSQDKKGKKGNKNKGVNTTPTPATPQPEPTPAPQPSPQPSPEPITASSTNPTPTHSKSNKNDKKGAKKGKK